MEEIICWYSSVHEFDCGCSLMRFQASEVATELRCLNILKFCGCDTMFLLDVGLHGLKIEGVLDRIFQLPDDLVWSWE